MKVAKRVEDLDFYGIHGLRMGRLGDWMWCLHCGRCFKLGEYREVRRGRDVLQLCPYDDCDGSPFDWFPWIVVKPGEEPEMIGEHKSDCPHVPKRGEVYS